MRQPSSLDFDPEAHGAECWRCPLRDQRIGLPVPPESPRSPLAIIVGANPGPVEVEKGRPFVGPSGVELMQGLAAVGAVRSQFKISNAILCLHPMTQVWVEDGHAVRIISLVRGRYPGRVWALSSSGELVLSKVVGWHENPLGERRWIKLTSQRARRNKQGVAGPVLTNDHLILSKERGWIPVGELSPHESIATADRRAVGRGESVIIGSLLGDGGIHNNRFRTSHTIDKQEYLQLKATALSTLGVKTGIVHTDRMKLDGLKARAELHIGASRWFSDLREAFYGQGQLKVLPPDLKLDPLALATWFLDDGNLQIRPNRLNRASLATCDFSKEAVEGLAGMLHGIGLEDARAVWTSRSRSGGYWRISLGPIDVERLASIIAPFVPPSMEYKLPEFHRGHFDARHYAPTTTEPYYDASETSEFEGPWSSRAYCLEVEQGSSFITVGGFVVHNCCPPGAARGALERFLHELTKTNKRRERQAKDRDLEFDPIPSPLECCRPRLLAEIREVPRVITLGGTALHSVLGRPTRVMDARGGPREVALGNSPAPEMTARVLPTLHPSFVISSRRWRGPFRADLGRAVRWFTSGLAWQDPRRLEAPTSGQLIEFLDRASRQAYTTCDLETFPGFPEVSHYDPLYDRIGLVGIGTANGRATAIIPFRSIEGSSSSYTEEERKLVVRLLRDYLTSPRFVKVGHNFNYYDRMVIESRLGVTPSPVVDTIALHKLADPEMPHSLGFVGSIHTDVSSWKAGHLATDAKTDHDWIAYNSIDLAVTALAYPGLERVVLDRNQSHLLPIVHRLQDLCVGLHRAGMRVDEGKRREWDSKLLREAKDQLSDCRRLSGVSDLNPGSTAQLRNLLFDDLGIAPHHYSEKTGEASTDDDALRAFLSETWSLPKTQRDLVQAIRAFRKVIKLRGTYVTKLRPISDRSVAEPVLAWDEEETEEEREKRREKHASSPGLTLPDGRVHPDYNAHGTLGWRLSSSNPNAQNFPDRLREIIVAGPGNVLVGCDEAQLELRMIAGLAKAAVYCEAFWKKEDPHRALCLDFFGEKFTSAGKEQQKALRVFVKQFTYASGYRAFPETVHDTLAASEDEEGRLLYPDITLRQTSAFHDKWLRRNPEIETWWNEVLEEWRRSHFLKDPILGLRVDFLDGEDPSKMINFKPQSGGSAIVHLATFDVLAEIPFEKWGRGTGIITQTHDSLVVECPESEGEKVKGILEDAMRMDGRQYGLDVPFLGESKIGRSWKEV